MFAGPAFAGDKWDKSGDRFGVQFGGFDLGGIYYGKDLSWAGGFAIGYDSEEIEVGGEDFDNDELSFLIFARKNFEIRDRTLLGFGILADYSDLDLYKDGKQITGDKWGIAPYFIVDYFVSNNVILNAGAEIVNVDFVTANGIDEKKDRVNFFDPFLSLTYLF